MTSEEIQKTIELLLDQHAKFNASISQLEAAQAQTAESIQLLTGKMIELTDNVNGLEVRMDELRDKVDNVSKTVNTLSKTVNTLSETVGTLSETVGTLSEKTDSIITEMREGFDKLILANEVTRDLAEKVAQLTINTSQRVTTLEGKVQ
ncbi:MAG: hypothetical protein ACJ74J_02165 [Blastocatellia bacterium]